MSGAGYPKECPRCGGEMYCWADWQPIEYQRGDCLECGFHFRIEEWQLSLEEVNELRANWGFEPLAKLREAKASPHTQQPGEAV